MEDLLERNVLGSSYAERRNQENTDSYLARLLGDPRMVRIQNAPASGSPAGGSDIYVGHVDPNNPVQVVAVAPSGAVGDTKHLSELRWSRLHFLDPDRSRYLVRTQPAPADLASVDNLTLKSVGSFAHERADQREYTVPTLPGERPILGVLREVADRNVPDGVSRLCPQVSLYTLAWSKNAWLERQ